MNYINEFNKSFLDDLREDVKESFEEDYQVKKIAEDLGFNFDPILHILVVPTKHPLMYKGNVPPYVVFTDKVDSPAFIDRTSSNIKLMKILFGF